MLESDRAHSETYSFAENKWKLVDTERWAKCKKAKRQRSPAWWGNALKNHILTTTRAALHPPAGFAENRRTEEIPRIDCRRPQHHFPHSKAVTQRKRLKITWLLWELYSHTESRLTHLGSFLKEPERDLLGKCRFLKKGCCKGHPIIQSTPNSDSLYWHCISMSLTHLSRLPT